MKHFVFKQRYSKEIAIVVADSLEEAKENLIGIYSGWVFKYEVDEDIKVIVI